MAVMSRGQQHVTASVTAVSSAALQGLSPGGIHLALLLTQDIEVQALLVRASRAGGHAEVRARILDLNGVDSQGATWQELQPGEGEQGSPAGALHSQASTHGDWEVPSQPYVTHVH